MGGHGLHVVVLLVATWLEGGMWWGQDGGGREWVVSVWSFPTEERAQQNHASQSHARQDPAVEALLALPALGCCIVPVEFHKSVLQGERREGKVLFESSNSNVGGWEKGGYLHTMALVI